MKTLRRLAIFVLHGDAAGVQFGRVAAADEPVDRRHRADSPAGRPIGGHPHRSGDPAECRSRRPTSPTRWSRRRARCSCTARRRARSRCSCGATTARITNYEVIVRRDLSPLEGQIRAQFPNEPIAVAVNGKDVVLSGVVSAKYVIDRAKALAAGYVDKPENIVNMLRQQESTATDQVMLKRALRRSEPQRDAGAGRELLRRADGRRRLAWDAAPRSSSRRPSMTTTRSAGSSRTSSTCSRSMRRNRSARR